MPSPTYPHAAKANNEPAQSIEGPGDFWQSESRSDHEKEEIHDQQLLDAVKASDEPAQSIDGPEDFSEEIQKLLNDVKAINERSRSIAVSGEYSEKSEFHHEKKEKLLKDARGSDEPALHIEESNQPHDCSQQTESRSLSEVEHPQKKLVDAIMANHKRSQMIVDKIQMITSRRARLEAIGSQQSELYEKTKVQLLSLTCELECQQWLFDRTVVERRHLEHSYRLEQYNSEVEPAASAALKRKLEIVEQELREVKEDALLERTKVATLEKQLTSFIAALKLSDGDAGTSPSISNRSKRSSPSESLNFVAKLQDAEGDGPGN